MKPDFDTILKQHMSVNNSDIPDAESRLLEAAREKVKMRQKQNYKKPTWFFNFSWPQLNAYHTGFATLIIISIFYFSLQNYSSDIRSGNRETTNSSINSSTVLASLSQYTAGDPSVNSSTVLTSIITFVAKN